MAPNGFFLFEASKPESIWVRAWRWMGTVSTAPATWPQGGGGNVIANQVHPNTKPHFAMFKTTKRGTFRDPENSC